MDGGGLLLLWTGGAEPHIVLVLQGSDKEHGEEEAVRGQQSPDFL